jgi:hypothetical protein
MDLADAHVAFAKALSDSASGLRKLEVGLRARNEKEVFAPGDIIDSVTIPLRQSQMHLEKALGFELTAV